MNEADDTALVRAGWAVRTMILAGGPAAALAISFITPVLPAIEAELAHSATDKMLIKMLVGIVGLSMVIGAPLTGFLFDRIGPRLVLFINYTLFALAGTAGLYLADLHALVASRLLLGLAASGAVTASIILINTRLPKPERPTWMGAYISVALASSVVLHPIGGLLGEINWHAPFIIYLVGVPIALIAAIGLKEPWIARAPRIDESPAERVSLLRWFPYRFAAIGLAVGAVTYVPIIYVPFLLRDLGVASPALISFVLTGDIIAGAIIAFFYGRCVAVLGGTGAFVVSFGCAAVGALITASATNYVTVIVGMAIYGLGVAWFLPNLMYVLGQNVRADRQGRAAGLVKGVNYGASPLCVLIIEPVARIYGPASAILAVGLLAGAMLLWFMFSLVSARRRVGVAQPAE